LLVVRVERGTIGNSIRIPGKGTVIVILYLVVKELFSEDWLLPLKILPLKRILSRKCSLYLNLENLEVKNPKPYPKDQEKGRG
jgi:hypothetical protein